MRMPQELKTKWIEALESGEYKQGYDALCDASGGYCCLGVLEHVADGEVERDMLGAVLKYPSKAFYARIGADAELEDYGRTILSEMNDLGYSFATIAEHIRTKVEGY